MSGWHSLVAEVVVVVVVGVVAEYRKLRPHSGRLSYLHHRNCKLFFHPVKFDNFKDEKISDFKTVSVSQSKNLLD